MDLEEQPRAGRDELSHPIRKDVRPSTGNARRQPIRDKTAAPVRAGSTWRLDKHQNMVHHGPAARLHLGGSDPFVLRKAGIDHDELVRHRSLGRDLEWLGHRNDHVRLGNPPAVHKRDRLGQILGVALRSAVLDPIEDLLFLLLRKPAVVGELPVARVGVPGRHASLVDHFLNRIGPADNVVVGGKCERGDLTGSVALQAMLLKDGRDVLGVGYAPLGELSLELGQ